mmetsp:Transcript_33964/g.79421  ORF Transcript_33964/g.79421 Transcript_33964/m.79421 type:complete len:1287 (+) Transcript_33964:164-4024(+)
MEGNGAGTPADNLEQGIETTSKPDSTTKTIAKKETKVPLRKVFSLASPSELLLAHLGHIGAIGNGFGQPLLCLFFGDLIDAVAADGDLMPELRKACLNMTLVGVGAAVFSAIQLASFKIFAEAQASHFRNLYFNAVLHQDVSWFDTREIAALPTSMSSDAEKLIEALSDKFGNSLMSWWAFLGGFVMALILGWQVALMMMIILPLMMVGAVTMGTAIQEMQQESQGWYKQAATVVEECLFAFRTVVAFGGEKRELKTFEYAVEMTRKGGVKNGFKLGASLGYTMFVVFLGYALAFYWGAYLISEGIENPRKNEPWSAGDIMSVFFCVFIGSFYLGNVQPGLVALTQAQQSFKNLYDATNSPLTIERRLKDNRDPCPEIDSIELAEVHFSYPARPDVPILRGLNIMINKGQKVAVVGESGSGKSTVMALMERFYDPQSGFVKVNGIDIKTFAVKTLRRRIGYVGQEPVLFATSVKDNILQGSVGATSADLEQVAREAELSFIDALPDKMNTYVGSGGSQFSGGQKQRIAIARALIKKASVLFFDEATSALDNKSEKMIQGTIANIAKSSGNLTIVSIAHRLSTIKDSGLIYVLSRGLVVESGTHQELVTLKGTYYALAAAQQLAGEGDVGAQAVSAADITEVQNFSDVSTATPPDPTTPALVDAGNEPAFTKQISNNTKPSLNEEEKEKERQKLVAKEYKVPMARVLSYCKPEWVFLIPALLGSMMDGASMPMCAWAMIKGLENFQASPDQIKEDMEMVCIIFLCIAAGDVIGVTMGQGCFAIIGEAMTKRLRVELLVQLFRQEIGFHDDPEHTPAKLGKALELWTYRMSNLVYAFGGKAGAMTSIVVGLTLAFVYSWQMALGMLAAIPIMVFTSMLQFLVSFGGASVATEGLQQAQQVLSDAIQNSRTCHASVCEDELVSLYRSLLTKVGKGSTRRHFLSGLAYGFATGTMYWVMAGGFYYAGILVDKGEADFVEVMTAFIGIFYAAMGAGQCAMTMGDASKAKVAAHDMFKLLDRQTQIDSWQPQGSTPTFQDPMAAGQIEFEEVRFRYPFRPDVEVLKGMCFRVMPGESVGLVGPSGGGKSTVMALLQRFYDPASGHVLVGPQKEQLNNLNIRWWRKQLGFVGQEPILFNTTVRANVTYGLEDGEQVSNEWFEKCAKMANLAFLDNEPKRFETEVGPRGSRLSGGQKQRVAICRALVRNPPVLLFDEATSALDTQSEKVVQEALETARLGRTSFSIAHRLSTIADCNVIVVVSAGLVVESGTHEELMAMDGVYQKLVAAAGANA